MSVNYARACCRRWWYCWTGRTLVTSFGHFSFRQQSEQRETTGIPGCSNIPPVTTDFCRFPVGLERCIGSASHDCSPLAFPPAWRRRSLRTFDTTSLVIRLRLPFSQRKPPRTSKAGPPPCLALSFCPDLPIHTKNILVKSTWSVVEGSKDAMLLRVNPATPLFYLQWQNPTHSVDVLGLCTETRTLPCHLRSARRYRTGRRRSSLPVPP